MNEEVTSGEVRACVDARFERLDNEDDSHRQRHGRRNPERWNFEDIEVCGNPKGANRDGGNR